MIGRPMTAAKLLRDGYAPLWSVVDNAVVVCGARDAESVMKIIRRMEPNPIMQEAFEQIAAEYFAPRR